MDKPVQVTLFIFFAKHDRYFRLPPPSQTPYSLHFLITAGAQASNSPVLSFNRHAFRPLKFEIQGLSDPFVQLQIARPGCYEFYVEYLSPTGTFVRSPPGAFVVDPVLKLPTERDSHHETILPLDGINILTVIPKWMPTVNHWPQFFQSFSDTGYNMVHFAPVNSRGVSNSPYAIYDQLSLSDDLFSGKLSEQEKDELLGKTLRQIKQQFRVLSVSDVVWNHTACNSLWLQHHPEAGYNLVTSPHLRSAYELDEAIMQFSAKIEDHGFSAVLETEEQLTKIVDFFKTDILADLNLWQFYVVDVKMHVDQFKNLWREVKVPSPPIPFPLREEALGLKKLAFQDPKTFLRFSKGVDLNLSVQFMEQFVRKYGISSASEQINAYQSLLDEINLDFYKEWDGDRDAIISGISSRAKYLRIEQHGPRLGKISQSSPIVDTYFTRLPRNDVTKSRKGDELYLANNGWIWNADPLMNFAGPESKAYLRREVIAWGDCVKLRYGDGPQDNPWLWDHMTQYTLKMARLFHGFRIDNCHSTPIHVAAYLLDKARALNPNLYVFAELFTGSEEKDIMFVSKLGINSLIREAMQAWDPAELSRLAHRFGGCPVGSFTLPVEQLPLQILGHEVNSSFYHETSSPIVVEIKGSTPHALFMDCTHDNETPHEKRTAEDTLPNAAITAMSICAVGSVKGYDEIVPKLLNVVTETRKYRLPRRNDGILPSKTELLTLHHKLAVEGYSEIHVHQEGEFISIHRVHPITHEGYLLIARCAFKNNGHGPKHSPIRLRNQRAEVFQSASLTVDTKPGHSCLPKRQQRRSFPNLRDLGEDLSPPLSPVQYYHGFDGFDVEHDDQQPFCGFEGCISGLPCLLEFSSTLSRISDAQHHDLGNGQFETVISVHDNFNPGSIVIYRTFVEQQSSETTIVVGKTGKEEPSVFERLWSSLALDNHNNGIKFMLRMGYDALAAPRPWFRTETDHMWPPGLLDAVKDLNLAELNLLLYRSYPEEKETMGEGLYDIPGHGSLVYAGIQGFASCLLPVCSRNDTGHALCNNLRQGPWMMEYTLNRIRRFSNDFHKLVPLYQWLQTRFDYVKAVGPSFGPKYFAIVMLLTHQALKFKAFHWQKLLPAYTGPHPWTAHTFIQEALMTTVQLYGSLYSTGLFAVPYPGDLYLPNRDIKVQGLWRQPSLAAGLTHFATEYMRCWGRDIFISLRGLFLLPGYYNAARAHLIAFGSTLRHGLIPNLLDQGNKPRYNARDATWFWFYAVASYCRTSPEGNQFLDVKIHRRFIPTKRYHSGPGFGSDEGHVPDEDTWIPPTDSRAYYYTNTVAELLQEVLDRHFNGIAFREWNAGPNLDHAMSDEGFNVKIEKGKGGILYGGNQFNCGTWMDKMGDSAKAGNRGKPATPRDGAPIEIVGLLKHCLGFIIEIEHTPHWHWKTVGKTTYKQWSDEIQQSFESLFYVPSGANDPNVQKTEIYKDVVGATHPSAEYQLRPNLCIAMAPELFDPSHARACLEIEWLWVTGYFLRAYYHFFTKAPGHDPMRVPQIVLWIQSVILRHKKHMHDMDSNPYCGLPELTNKDGAFCYGSSATQAWSTATMIELFNDIK
ncbi:glucanotransferase domain of glycogen debranching enzyme-domain-containing protein [Gorgonomyces haynaldii]|nr:glucanotransferase domain of glycogen debranching enzyme-domain-containing protein [Gorgonomyces haynaldii]